LLALVFLAVAVRLLYIDAQPATSHLDSTDAWGYHRLGLNLSQGNGFSLHRQAPFEPDSVRTPLYPLFLLLTRRLLSPDPRIAAIAQAMLDGISAVLTYQLTVLLAATLGSSTGQRGGRIAALLYALNPVQVRQVNELLTETLLSCLLLFCLCTLVHYLQTAQPASGTSQQRPGKRTTRLAIALGLLSALAALCKPNVQYLPLLWMPAMLLAARQTRRVSRNPRPEHETRACSGCRESPASKSPKGSPRWQDAILMLAAFGALLSPWVIRNQTVFGRPFLSTAFQGNVSRISAPAALLTARGQYAIPWSSEWESAFGEIVAQAAQRYRWDQPWETMDTRARARADRQVYQVARETLVQIPSAWITSHLQGTLRHLEPQIYRSLHALWTGQPWPPDVLDDALIHALRALARENAQHAGQIIAQERWVKLTPLQKAIWWSMLGALLLTTTLAARGARALRRHPALILTLLGTIVYLLLLPGPIAYERFRVPALGPILALAALSLGEQVPGTCTHQRLHRKRQRAFTDKPL
jgi:hypothetical protein